LTPSRPLGASLQLLGQRQPERARLEGNPYFASLKSWAFLASLLSLALGGGGWRG